MFKRFQVIDLYRPYKPYEVKEWIDVNESPHADTSEETYYPETARNIFRVKLSNGNEKIAYFFLDRITLLANLKGIEPTHWWDTRTKEPLYTVTHWGKE